MLGFVVGLKAEARIAAGFGHPVAIGGGTPSGAHDAAARLISDVATALVSFGLAGGLDPALRPGEVVIPRVVLAGDVRWTIDAELAERFGGISGDAILGGLVIAATAMEKRRLRAQTQADAIDLESGAVAAVAVTNGCPFIVIRAICDPAERDLPPAALLALDRNGAIGLLAVLRSVMIQPRQIPALLALARDAGQARRALMTLVRRFKITPTSGHPGDNARGVPAER